jgi:hypothetical protein
MEDQRQLGAAEHDRIAALCLQAGDDAGHVVHLLLRLDALARVRP